MKKDASKRWPGLLRDSLIIGLVVGAVLLACIAGAAFADGGTTGDPWGYGVASHIANFKH